MTAVTMTLAEQVNEEHRLAVAGYSSALDHAVNAGRLLARQKNALTHGAWLPWLQENFDGSARIAQRYMQLAAAPELEEASAPTHLTIEQALEHVSVPRPKRATASDAGAMLQGLSGGQITSQIAGQSDDFAPLLAVGNEWTTPQQRKRHKAIDLLEESRGKLDEANDPRLSAFSAASILREAAIKARQAASELDALAFSFEL